MEELKLASGLEDMKQRAQRQDESELALQKQIEALNKHQLLL